MPRIEPTEYTVYPDGYDEAVNADAFAWTLRIEQRSPGGWAVTDGHRCYGRRGRTAYESNPSSRTDRFKAAYRFDLDEAKRIATAQVARRRINGFTLAEASAWVAARIETA